MRRLLRHQFGGPRIPLTSYIPSLGGGALTSLGGDGSTILGTTANRG